MLKLVAILYSLFLSNSALAQNLTEKSFIFLWPRQTDEDARLDLAEAIVTDRPDFTEASSTVGKGVLQFESGYTFNYDKNSNGNEKQHTYPELLIRQGVLKDWFELRLASSLSSIESPGYSPTGFNDLYIGAKLGIASQQEYFPEISVVPQMTLPTGAFGSSNILPGINVLYSWDISNETYIGGSSQYNRADESSDLFSKWAQSATIGTSLSDHFGCYFEWYAFFPIKKSLDDEHFLNGGITYLLTNNMMFDVRVGRSISQPSEISFYGVGFSIRFI